MMYGYGEPLVSLGFISTLFFGTRDPRTTKSVYDDDPAKNPYLFQFGEKDPRTTFGKHNILKSIFSMYPSDILNENEKDCMVHNGLKFDIDSWIPISTKGECGRKFQGARCGTLFIRLL